MTFPDTRRTYYYSRPGLPPPTEETPGFWNRPVDMRRAYQHLQADYDRLHNTVIQLTKEVRAEREARLATDNAHKQLLGKLVEERRLKEEALKEALGRENELAAAQQMRQRLQVVDQNEANYKAYIQDLETRLSAEKRESELWRLRSIEHRQTIQKLQAKQTALSRVPPPPPTRTQEVRTPVPLESLYEDIITPVARGLQSQPPTSRTRTRPHFEAKKGNQTSILNWAERVEGPSTVNRVRQSNTVQPGGRVATPPISPAHSVYLGDDQDDEFKDLHYAFPPEQEVPAPDRNRRSMAPQPASSDELHRQSFRGPKVNLPEPFDGTKAKARTWFTDIMNYIVMKSSEFGDEQAKIRWAISYIRGEHVNHWKTSLFERMDGGEVVYFTLQDFAKDFKRMYYLANPELEGQRMLRSMQQRFKPWEEFITEWEHWVKVSGYKDEQLLLQLLRAAMRKELCDRVWASEGISQDVNSYQLWIQVAARLDLQQQQQWAATFEDRKGKGKKSDSKARQVGIGKGSATAPETANAVRTARSPVKNVDEAGRSVPHKDIVGVENERDKLRKCGACGKLRNEGGSCTDIWHTPLLRYQGAVLAKEGPACTSSSGRNRRRNGGRTSIQGGHCGQPRPTRIGGFSIRQGVSTPVLPKKENTGSPLVLEVQKPEKGLGITGSTRGKPRGMVSSMVVEEKPEKRHQAASEKTSEGCGQEGLSTGEGKFSTPVADDSTPPRPSGSRFSILSSINCNSSTTSDNMGASSGVQTISSSVGSRDDEAESSDRARQAQEAAVLNSTKPFISSSNTDGLQVATSTPERTRKKSRKTTLRVYLDHPQAIVPSRQSAGAAGYDLHSAEQCTIGPHSRGLVDTGLKLMIPSECYGRIAPRSGLAVKKGIDVGAGVIDSDYTGRVKILLINTLDTPFEIEYGDRIAQLILERNNTPVTEVVTEIAETARGTAGFGSTGNKLRGNFQVRAVRRHRQIDIPMTIEVGDRNIPANALLDSGCTGCCVDERFIKKFNIPIIPFERPVQVFNADGSPNRDGDMTHYVFLDIVVQGHRERRKLNVTTLSDHDVFLGFDWLEYHNPEIDWAKRTLRFTRCNCGELKLEDGDKVLALDSDYIRKQFSEYEHIRATKATDLAIAQGKSTKAKSMQEVVPEEYWEYKGVFEEAEFDQLPERRI